MLPKARFKSRTFLGPNITPIKIDPNYYIRLLIQKYDRKPLKQTYWSADPVTISEKHDETEW